MEDGRSAIRERHHQAILDAAMELIRDSDATRLNADDLAERAGVSRRTIFNHFATLDDVLLAVCTQLLSAATADLRVDPADGPPGPGGRVELFRRVCDDLRAADLAGPIVQLWRALGGDGADNQRAQAFAQQALAEVAGLLATQLMARDPSADPLDVALLASLVTHGIGVIAGHWIETAPPGQAPSRPEWDLLLGRLLDTLGSGYLPRP